MLSLTVVGGPTAILEYGGLRWLTDPALSPRGEYSGLVKTTGGRAYVFVEPKSGWAGVVSESAKLTPSDSAADDGFGQSVAISGDAIVVGAPGHQFARYDYNHGDAYVFMKPRSGWAGTLRRNAELRAATAHPGTASAQRSRSRATRS
jgi:hypothetical protein